MASVRLIAQTSDTTTAEVTFSSGHRTITIITNASHIVMGWINDVINTYAPPASPNARQVVGLHIQRSPPYGGIALLKLCVGNSCLVYQLRHLGDAGPFRRLFDLFNDNRFCFTGVAIQQATNALRMDLNIRVRVASDLGDAAVRRLQREDLRWAGLAKLGREVMGIVIIRPDSAQKSALLERVLPLELIQFACVDAVFSYELGRILLG